MKNFVTSVIFFSLSLSSFAGSNYLYKIKTIATAYYSFGDDNNYLETALVNSSDFDFIKSKKIIEPNEIINSIKECVFMQQGAYGDHLSEELQDRIAERMSRFIQENQNSALYKSSMNQIELGISSLFNAPCILAIEDRTFNRVLLMQGGTSD